MSNRSDNFNRADTISALNTPSDGGSDWVITTNGYQIHSNQCQVKATIDNIAYLESSISDCDIQYTIAFADSGQNLGISARVLDLSNAILGSWGAASGNSTGVSIIRFQAGGYTTLASDSAGVPATSDVMKLNCNGTSITLYQNGSSRLNTTSSFDQTETKHGIFSYNDNTSLVDDFSITALGGDTLMAQICM